MYQQGISTTGIAQPAHPAMGGYEFSQAENTTIGRLASRSKAWGVLSLLVGLLLLAAGGALALKASDSKPLLAGGVALLGLAIQPLVSGALYVAAGASLSAVVDTSGQDVPLMMNALRKLTNAVRVEAIAALVAFPVGLLLALWVGKQ